MKTIVIIDTNVLLSDPDALFVYADAEVILPQIILSELDKIKVARNDKETRYRGREISRILFELSEYGPLVDGITLDNNSIIRVAPHNPEGFPSVLNAKNADDLILGRAWQAKEQNPDARVILLTNDLNMLLKAQTFGIEVQRHERHVEPGVLSKFANKMSRKRLSLGWLAIPILMVALLAGLWLFRVPSPISIATSNSVFETTSYPLKEVEYLNALKKDPTNIHIWLQLGQLYTDWAQQLQQNSQFDEERAKLESAVDAYKRVLSTNPTSAATRTSLGTAYFFLGDPKEAISQYVQAINYEPNYAPAHFSLAVALVNLRDMNGAKGHFESYLKLEQTGERSDYARQKLLEIEEQSKAGR